MPAALGPRFALEAGFLVLLAVVVGLADLSTALILLVMAVGWLLVSLIEYSAWRQSPGPAKRSVTVEAAPAAPVHEEVVEDVAPPLPPAPPPPEEETIVAPPEVEPVAPPQDAPPAAAAEEPVAFRPEPKATAYRLEPLQPRPSRRWIIFGPRARPEGDSEEEG